MAKLEAGKAEDVSGEVVAAEAATAEVVEVTAEINRRWKDFKSTHVAPRHDFGSTMGVFLQTLSGNR